MDHDLLNALSAASPRSGQRRRAPSSPASGDFSAQVAAFYPYPPVGEPGARNPSPERQKNTSVGASAGIGRRRQQRED